MGPHSWSLVLLPGTLICSFGPHTVQPVQLSALLPEL
jgi:hypothetical protein